MKKERLDSMPKRKRRGEAKQMVGCVEKSIFHWRLLVSRGYMTYLHNTTIVKTICPRKVSTLGHRLSEEKRREHVFTRPL